MESPFKRDIVSGKVALITGGGSGIGLEISRQLGLHGAKIVIMGRRQAVLEKAAAFLRKDGVDVRPCQGDVRSLEDAKRAVRTAVESFGKLDILINAAAGNFLSPAESLTPKGFKTVLDIDTLGTFTMCHAAFPALKRSPTATSAFEQQQPGGGHIINISATLHYGATWYQSHVSAAKAAIDSLTRSLALEWGRDFGIRVNAVAPGPIQDTAGMFKLTPGFTGQAGSASPPSGSSPPSSAPLLPDLTQLIPLGRPGTAWEIAMAILFLSSSAGGWISGEILVVDGASWLYKPQLVGRDVIQNLSRSLERKSREVGVAQSKL